MNTRCSLAFAASIFLTVSVSVHAESEFVLHEFRKLQLTDRFCSEGASFADFNNDGHQDIVSGPYWYEGPDFKNRHEIYEPRAFNPLEYSDNFFVFPYDFDSDGSIDILVVGLPGEAARWYRNPDGEEKHWDSFLAYNFVGNESPVLADLDGDGQPELIFNTQTHLGYAKFDLENPTAAWEFIPVSDAGEWGQYVHGLGFGDIDGDGRTDLITARGWWKQPESLDGNPIWEHHPLDLGPGAQILVADLTGNGDSELIHSLQAHGWGLAWFEKDGNDFRKETILGERHRDNRYGVRFSQIHALALSDIDGDGIPDVVTGKRFWAHGPDQDPEPNAPAVLYWFKTIRSPDGKLDFLPFKIDGNSGVGTQVVAGDVSGNGYPDIVVGNKNGTVLFLNEPVEVTKEEWEQAQPKVLKIHELR